jgi:hypothetical protein
MQFAAISPSSVRSFFAPIPQNRLIPRGPLRVSSSQALRLSRLTCIAVGILGVSAAESVKGIGGVLG